MEDAPPVPDPTARLAEDHEDETPADPDAQTTVTDFLDFTEYLPSDMMRSLTLIGKLDETYINTSTRVHELTTQWGQLPSLPANERPSPVQLRADISEQLNQAVSSRVFAHAEAMRMSESVDRHYNKAKVLLAKLQTMMDNYPTGEEQLKSPVAARSPQATRNKGIKTEERKRPKIPKITVPGEVLAPYDIEYDYFSDGSDESSEEEEPATARRTPGPTPRIKIVTSRPPKSASRPRNGPQLPAPTPEEMAAHAAALLKPPPPDAVIGSADAPWLQLTDYELAKLRKRMKKNATWTPSETMVARELRVLGRGPEEFKLAKQKAEEEGTSFEPSVPGPIDEGVGTQKLPAGAISADSDPSSNRGMKLNEAKKSKREALAKQAAEEAEASARKMAATAKLFLGRGNHGSASPSETPKESNGKNSSRSNPKRKREEEEAGVEAAEPADTPSARPQIKRTKTETPVPPPQYGKMAQSKPPVTETKPPAPSGPATRAKKTETPVPLPIPLQSSTSQGLKSPTPSFANGTSATVPKVETPVPLPKDRRKSSTPVVPPTRELPARESARRETRGDAAKRTQNQPEDADNQSNHEQPARRSTSRVPDNLAPELARRPASRGKALSQEPQPSTTDRPRRASTARNTPAPETRPPSRRSKRPAPGIVSTTSSGGSAAVGKRKAAPKKKARTTKKKGEPAVEEMEEVDDEGKPIDPDEPRYCLCNRVSFGTMISCDNIDVSTYANFVFFIKHNPWKKDTDAVRSSLANTLLTQTQGCKGEWFHLECVGLKDIPARTTKWYCPDCRKRLNIGEKGEVNARGIRK